MQCTHPLCLQVARHPPSPSAWHAGCCRGWRLSKGGLRVHGPAMAARTCTRRGPSCLWREHTRCVCIKPVAVAHPAAATCHAKPCQHIASVQLCAEFIGKDWHAICHSNALDNRHWLCMNAHFTKYCPGTLLFLVQFAIKMSTETTGRERTYVVSLTFMTYAPCMFEH